MLRNVVRHRLRAFAAALVLVPLVAIVPQVQAQEAPPSDAVAGVDHAAGAAR